MKDILRKEAEKKGIQPTRENLQKLGNEVKESMGNGILSRLLVEQAEEKDIIADGIRTLDEMKELRKYNDVIVIGIDAPQELRYKRLEKRKRKGDPISFEEFKKIDDHENSGKTKGQEINNCLREADYRIINDSNISKLKKSVLELLGK